MKLLAKYLLVLSTAVCGLQAAPILQLSPPGGALTGAPGQVVGWGFTLTNTSDFLVVTSADYVTATPLGTFTDFISGFNFIVAGPVPESSTVSQSFDASSFTGIGSFLIDPGAVAGALSTGVIRLTYDLYSVSPNDPLFDPATDLRSGGLSLDADASVQVSATPEPASWILMGASMAGLVIGRRRLGRRSATQVS
jgi:hypothetical protein